MLDPKEQVLEEGRQMFLMDAGRFHPCSHGFRSRSVQHLGNLALVLASRSYDTRKRHAAAI
ncbi:hypothetical protein AWM70_03785 [Paenibacillus yonginensis]|uniref:Uncharacterized protein n=1 Tax=Paenibacillus yonginensis TaxID=1462996 RepID=A0A1B1MX88_9BACL|nr:hypothetical protein [Paenibacillus yonginensis]ANS73801.1 hypothetical protein AWM70_03785 [Paenibacillus yonginensis]